MKNTFKLVVKARFGQAETSLLFTKDGVCISLETFHNIRCYTYKDKNSAINTKYSISQLYLCKNFDLKKTILILIISIFCFGATAQKQIPMNLPKLDNQVAHFGYSLGLNVMDFNIRPSDVFLPGFDTVYAVEVTRFVGFNINMISNLRLGEYIDVRFLPGLMFGQRNLQYKYIKNGEYRLHNMMIESTFLDFPLYFKYRAARINNWRPFIIGGVNSRIDLAAQRKINPEERPKIRLKPVDAYYELGVGADFFLEYFMFGIELKSSWGLFNVVAYDDTQYSEYFRKLNSHMYVISFHFEGGKIDKIKWWN